MAEPESDDGDIAPRLEEMHRGRVAEGMRRDGSPLERRARGGGSRDRLLETVRDPGARERATGAVGEHGGVGLASDAEVELMDRFTDGRGEALRAARAAWATKSK